ncbi:MAG: hypothetical protein ACFFD2_11075 [Promethearchaeota archaeon]
MNCLNSRKLSQLILIFIFKTMAYYGAFRVTGNRWGLTNTSHYYLGSATGAQGDLVNLESGELAILSAGDEVLGVLMEAMTSSSTNVEVLDTIGVEFLMDNDNDTNTFDATMVGNRGNIIGGTGAQQMDTSSLNSGGTAGAKVGQLVCLEYNPQGYSADLDADTSVGKFMAVEHEYGLNSKA